MKICLISPKSIYYSRDPDFFEYWNNSKYNQNFRHFWSGLSTGLLIVAGLTPSSDDIELIDENIQEIDFKKEFDLVGITATTQQATRAYTISEEFRKRGIKTVIGGIHATVMPDEAKLHADSVVVGEAENVWADLLLDYKKHALQPFYRSPKTVNLEDSPFPRYDLLDKAAYKIVWVQASRGCPHDCEFCVASKVFGTKYRLKSVHQVVSEIRHIKEHCGDVFIGFADDNIMVNRKFITALLQEIIPLRIRWFGQSDISIARDKELLPLLYKSGCTILLVGLESLKSENLLEINNNSWKFSKLNDYSLSIDKIQSSGIGVMGSFIFGFDHDDPSIFKSTADFVVSNNLYLSNFSILTPFPGSHLREKLSEENRLLPTPWNDYTLWDVNFVPKNMSVQQLQLGLFDAYKRILTEDACSKKANHFKNIFRRLMPS